MQVKYSYHTYAGQAPNIKRNDVKWDRHFQDILKSENKCTLSEAYSETKNNPGARAQKNF